MNIPLDIQLCQLSAIHILRNFLTIVGVAFSGPVPKRDFNKRDSDRLSPDDPEPTLPQVKDSRFKCVEES